MHRADRPRSSHCERSEAIHHARMTAKQVTGNPCNHKPPRQGPSPCRIGGSVPSASTSQPLQDVQRTPCRHPAFTHNVGINHGRGHIGMPQQLLHGPDVLAPL